MVSIKVPIMPLHAHPDPRQLHLDELTSYIGCSCDDGDGSMIYTFADEEAAKIILQYAKLAYECGSYTAFRK